MNNLAFLLKFQLKTQKFSLFDFSKGIALIAEGILFFIIKTLMSHLRKKLTNYNQSLHIKRRKLIPNPQRIRQHRIGSQLAQPKIHSQSIDMNNDKTHNLFNRNVHKFREIFNSNDQSQLPFMSSLRVHPRDTSPPKPTSQEPFEVATKTTCNQTARKSISDFRTASRRLATSYYRWHNKTGRNSLWSTQFQCSLRDYGEKSEEKRYYSYMKPIQYKDFQQKVYAKEQMICDRYRKSFVTK